jgi:carbonic anhydrase/acetyltransferase-like protein (isoleucine patch superfamily)
MATFSVPEPVIDPSALIAPGAQVHGRVSIGPHVFVLFGVVARAELDQIRIGAETNVQDHTILHCDEGIPCTVGTRVTIGHGAVVHGATVGDRALIGIGAILLNRSRLGDGAWLAAGSVLGEGKEIPPGTLAMGAPARPVRDLSDADLARADEGVEHYLELMEAYRARFS